MSKTFALEGFEPIKRIGGGGFGDVWLARQTNVDRRVAVKVGHTPIQDEVIRLRFERECKALGWLSGHPNIVEVFTAGTLDDGRPYLVLEYIDNGTLWQRLKRAPMTEDELVTVGEQLSGALTQVHASGVLHRDLKPENILMRSNGDAVLGDFGIARLQDGVNTTSAAITASVAYAAPEVLGGTRASAASDLYGIGVCLLAAIIRSVPFVDKGDKSIHPIISRVMSDEPPDLRSHGVSTDLAKLVESLLHKDPERRPDSAEAVHSAFQSLRSQPWPTGRGLLDGQSRSIEPQPPRVERTPRPEPARPAEPVADSTPSSSEADRVGRLPADSTSGSADRTDADADHPRPTARRAVRQPGERSRRAAGGARPARSTADGDHQVESAASVRAFAIAYIATLSIGAMVIYILAQILG